MISSSDWIEVRCKTCRRLFFKVSPDTKGRIEVFCKHCKNFINYDLPFRNNDPGQMKALRPLETEGARVRS